METVSYHVRVPTRVSEHINLLAKSTGVSANDVIIQTLKKQFNLPDSSTELIQALSIWLLKTYSKDRFPEEIVLITRIHIFKTPRLRKLYNQAISDQSGCSIDLKHSLNKKIGSCVQRTLNATSFSRQSYKGVFTYSLMRPK